MGDKVDGKVAVGSGQLECGGWLGRWRVKGGGLLAGKVPPRGGSAGPGRQTNGRNTKGTLTGR